MNKQNCFPKLKAAAFLFTSAEGSHLYKKKENGYGAVICVFFSWTCFLLRGIEYLAVVSSRETSVRKQWLRDPRGGRRERNLLHRLEEVEEVEEEFFMGGTAWRAVHMPVRRQAVGDTKSGVSGSMGVRRGYRAVVARAASSVETLPIPRLAILFLPAGR